MASRRLDCGEQEPDLLSGVEMPPGLNGYALVRQVHEHWPSTEILITSGREWLRACDLPPGAAVLATPCPSETWYPYFAIAIERAQTAGAGRPVAAGADLAEGTTVPFSKVG